MSQSCIRQNADSQGCHSDGSGENFQHKGADFKLPLLTNIGDPLDVIRWKLKVIVAAVIYEWPEVHGSNFFKISVFGFQISDLSYMAFNSKHQLQHVFYCIILLLYAN